MLLLLVDFNMEAVHTVLNFPGISGEPHTGDTGGAG